MGIRFETFHPCVHTILFHTFPHISSLPKTSLKIFAEWTAYRKKGRYKILFVLNIELSFLRSVISAIPSGS